MKKTNSSSKMNSNWKFSVKPILWYYRVLCILIVLIVAAGGLIFAVVRMRERTETTAQQLKLQIEYRVGQSLNLLHSLASQDRYTNVKVPAEQKVLELEKINSHFGYMMICYVDEEIEVYSEGGEKTSLASRDYMQRLFSTGQDQVTDSFSAGSDGKTLNYTIAVPLFSEDRIVGALFCALYFDELVDAIKAQALPMEVDALLLGSQNQIMSATLDYTYGDLYLENLKAQKLFGTNAAAVENSILSNQTSSFWSFYKGDFKYTVQTDIQDTAWNMISTSSLWSTYWSVFPTLLPVMLLSILFFLAVMLLTNRYVKKQMKVVDNLVESVQELEYKIYQNDRPENVDFNDIIHLTSTGLSDGLTGVATRTVFMNQLGTLLKNLDAAKHAALCFVDLDDLKKLNDTYGHETGDVGLKTVGYVLREYEKKYDGLVGRYGGDEFVLLLTDIDSDEELREVLGELVLRLQTTIMHDSSPIHIKCSVGVSVWNHCSDSETLIREADEALYFVKQNGKSYFKIHQDS